MPKRRDGFHQTTVELPNKTWKALKAALARRAERMGARHGIKVRPDFAPWLAAQAEETIRAYK